MPTINGRACVANGRQVYSRNLWQQLDSVDGYFGRDTTDGEAKINGDHPVNRTMKTLVAVTAGEKLITSIYNPNKVVNTANSNRWGFYDASGNLLLPLIQIDALNGELIQRFTVTVPENAVSVRLAFIQGPDNGNIDESIKIKVERGNKPTDWSPVDKVFSNGRQVYGRNLWQQLDSVDGYFGITTTDGEAKINWDHSINRTMKTLVAVTAGEKLITSIYNPNKVVNAENGNRWGFYDASGNLLLPLIQIDALNGELIQRFMVTVPSNAASVRLAFIQGLANGTIDESIKIKVERGNKPTDWSPAPEDVMF